MQIGKRKQTMVMAIVKFGLEVINNRGDVKWVTSRKYKIMNIMFKRKAGRRWAWKSPNCVTKAETDYSITNWTDIVIDVTVISQVNIGSDHRMVIRNFKLDVEVEWKN